MRKSFFIHTLLFFLFISFFAILVDARFGCCSGHNGVNCSAGAQGNGHVICNDGWTGSSCLYSEMVMCGGSSSSSTDTNSNILLPTNTPIPWPTWTPIPTNTPTPTLTNTPTPKPTKPILGITTKKVTKQVVSKKKTVKKKTFWQLLFNR